MLECDDCAMQQEKFDKLKQFIQDRASPNEVTIKNLLAEIYNLYQEYLISPNQEKELYDIVDPEEKYNSPADYWYEDFGDSEVFAFAYNL